MGYADDVREYCIERHIKPARSSNIQEITIRAGDIHNAMDFKDKLPLVCSALGATKFEQQANVQKISITGPSNGANALFKYKILPV